MEDLVETRAETRRLADLRMSAEEGRLTAAVAAGRHAAVLDDLHRHVADHPVREAARAQLMLALYRAGRQTEALAVFQEGRRLLADRYGLDPGAALRAMERQILGQDPALDPTETVHRVQTTLFGRDTGWATPKVTADHRRRRGTIWPPIGGGTIESRGSQ